MQINYLIVDDEPIAHKLIENFAAKWSELALKGNCYSALDAGALLQRHPIDLIFLDINMPKLNGFEFLSGLSQPPKIVIISAHQEYALQSYEYSITDYLLKPFNFERFSKAMDKVKASLPSGQIANPSPSAEQTIFIKDDKKHHQVALHDLNHIQANGNYTNVILNQGKRILSQMKISDLEKLLPKTQFIRVHRSYIINRQAITLLKANEVHLNDVVLPVGRVYKESLQSLRAKF